MQEPIHIVIPNMRIKFMAPFVAPYVVGNELAKEVIGLQMLMNITEEKFHIILIGPPGAAKSELGIFAIKNTPHGVKCGKDTKVAGLRGSIEKFGVKPGILHSTKGKLVVFDELDKAASDARDTLLEAMQERTVTVTGQCGNMTYEALVNIIATCNPKGDKWMGEPSLAQIPFRPALIKRFHMFVPFIDTPTEEYGAIGRSFHTRRGDTGAGIRDLVRERMAANPIVDITEEYCIRLGEEVGYIKRENQMFGDYMTPRSIDGAISLAKAHARLDGRGDVADQDIKYVTSIYNKAVESWMSF